MAETRNELHRRAARFARGLIPDPDALPVNALEILPGTPERFFLLWSARGRYRAVFGPSLPALYAVIETLTPGAEYHLADLELRLEIRAERRGRFHVAVSALAIDDDGSDPRPWSAFGRRAA